ncbi:MAG: hypothetical protein ACRELT_04345, partial [Longimicrobiales bacterium]
KKDRGVYFDFLEFERNIQKNQTPNTPAVSLLYALKAQVDRIEAEGMKPRIARHRAMAERTWTWCDELDLEVLVQDPAFRSPTVTCVRCPDGVTGSQVAAGVRKHGFQIATGYGHMKDETFRIGHMGEHTIDRLDALLAALRKVLKR